MMKIVNTHSIATATSRNREFEDIRSILDTLIDSKGLFLAILIAFILFGVGYVLLGKPRYAADVTLHIEQRDPKSSGTTLDKDLISYGNASLISSEIEILRSRLILGNVVDELQLYVDIRPKYFPLIGAGIARLREDRLIPEQNDVPSGQIHYAWGGERVKFEVLELPENLQWQALTLTALPDNRYLIESEKKYLSQTGTVGEVMRLGGLAGGKAISFRISELHAKKGTQFDMTISDRANAISAIQSELRILEQGADSGILKLTMTGNDATNVALTLNQLAQSYLQQNTDRHLLEIQQNLKFLENQLPLVEQDLERYEEALNEFRLRRGSVDLAAETTHMLSRMVVIETELRELDRKRGQLLVTLTNQHPNVQSLDSQLAQLRSELETLEKAVVKMPETQQQILRLNRNVDVNTELYTAMLTRIQELKVVIAGAVGNVRILDRAVASSTPVGPPMLASVAVGTVLGLLFGVITPLVRRSLRRGILNPSDLEAQLSLPVYATILHSSNQRKLTRQSSKNNKHAKALAHLDSNDIAIECLRNLRSSLLFSDIEKRNNVLQITSASPKVGKSFVSLNLAAVMASSGMKVLLVDADLRRGHLHKILAVPSAPGLSNCLSKNSTLKETVNKTEIENLWFIATGDRVGNPSELLLNRRFDALIAEVSSRFDYVILDGAPVLAAADAGIIGQIAGNTLLVVKAGTNPIEEIAESRRRLLQDSVNLTGAVVNDVKINSISRSYCGYVYEYGND